MPVNQGRYTSDEVLAVVSGDASVARQASSLTANRALTSDSNGKAAVSSVTATELGYLSGASSAIQTQLNSKQATITGGATTIATSDLATSRVLISDGNGKVAVGGATSGELNYLNGVTSSIHTQLNNKLPISDIANVANSGRKIVQQMIFAPDSAMTTGDGKGYLHICPPLSSKNLVYCHARLIAPGGGSGTTDIQIARNRSGSVVDMLSTKLTVDVNETGSDTAAAAYVINTSNDDVVDNDLLRIDVDALASTPGSGAIITLGFE